MAKRRVTRSLASLIKELDGHTSSIAANHKQDMEEGSSESREGEKKCSQKKKKNERKKKKAHKEKHTESRRKGNSTDMGKKLGPCLHCGTDSTPLWRNGPEDKPVLCNACGSRYRIWGTLEDYLPKHFQPSHLINLRNVKGTKNLQVKTKPASTNVLDSDNGGRNPILWNSRVPSKKRSQNVNKKMTPMKKFHEQLLELWKSLGKPNDESSPEEVLLFQNMNNFIPSNEIGVGGILLKPEDGTST